MSAALPELERWTLDATRWLGRGVACLLAVSLGLGAPRLPAAVGTVDAEKADAAAAARNETEQWVMAQVQAGEVADLRALVPDDENKRALTAEFLEALCTDALPGIKATRHGVRIVGAIFPGPVELDSVTVRGRFWLNFCHFEGPTSWVKANFSEVLSFTGSQFDADANFNGLKVGGGASFSEAIFAGRANFFGGNIGETFYANNCRFQDRDHPANFSGLKAQGDLSFTGSTFAGGAQFFRAQAGGSFIAAGAHFLHPQQAASFYSLKTGRGADFAEAVFAGPADFGDAEVGDLFSMTEAQFSNPAQAVNFSGMQVRANAHLDRTVFAGPVKFIQAGFLASLTAKETRFLNPASVVDLSGVKVEGTVGFLQTTVASGLNLGNASLGDLLIDGLNPPAGAPISQLNLAGTTIKRILAVQGLRVHDFSASDLTVGGPASLNGMQADRTADLSYADFNVLDLTGSRWPQGKAGRLQLPGLKYHYLRAAKEEAASHAALIDLADQAAYTADVYGELEAFFLRQGYRDDANRAYIAGRRRGRIESGHWFSFNRFWDWVLQSIGYGRYPGRALIPCALIVALGCVLFAPARMEPKYPEDRPGEEIYHRFWYSLTLFMPFVKLQYEDAWRPKRKERLLWFYVRVHTLLGWILVPFVLAAVTGILK